METSIFLSDLLNLFLQFLLTVLTAVAVPFAIYLGRRAKMYLEANIGKRNAELAVMIAQQAVLMAERLDQSGEGKKAIASNFALQMADRHNLNIDANLISSLIEGSVTLLREGAFSGAGGELQPLLIMDDGEEAPNMPTTRPRFVG